jgi:hypothetical protein
MNRATRKIGKPKRSLMAQSPLLASPGCCQPFQ